MDEKALSKGARYITLVCDLDAATIEYVAEARRMESLDGYFLSFPAAQLEGIRAIAMDMWPPYIASTLRHVPGARDKIVFDLYHVMSSIVYYNTQRSFKRSDCPCCPNTLGASSGRSASPEA